MRQWTCMVEGTKKIKHIQYLKNSANMQQRTCMAEGTKKSNMYSTLKNSGNMQQWTCMVEGTKNQHVQYSKKFGKYATVNLHGRRYKKATCTVF